jgi:hypothetical protein
MNTRSTQITRLVPIVTIAMVLSELLFLRARHDVARMFRFFPPTRGRALGLKVKPGVTVRRGEMFAAIESADQQ